MDTTKNFVLGCLKAIVAGLSAGLLAYQAGGQWQTSVIAGVVAAITTWVTPNLAPKPEVPPAP